MNLIKQSLRTTEKSNFGNSDHNLNAHSNVHLWKVFQSRFSPPNLSVLETRFCREIHSSGGGFVGV